VLMPAAPPPTTITLTTAEPPIEKHTALLYYSIAIVGNFLEN